MVTYYLDQHEPDSSGPVIMIRDNTVQRNLSFTATPIHGHLQIFPSIIFMVRNHSL